MSDQQEDMTQILASLADVDLDDAAFAESAAIAVTNAVLKKLRPELAKVYQRGFLAGYAEAKERQRALQQAAADLAVPKAPSFRIVDNRQSTRIVHQTLTPEQEDRVKRHLATTFRAPAW